MRRNNEQTGQHYSSRYSRNDQYGFDRPNSGSARSDYGEYAYGGRLNKQGMEDDHNWWDEATDEVSSWFGGEDQGQQAYNQQNRTGNQQNRNYSRQNNNRQSFYNIPIHNLMTRDVAMVTPHDSVQYAARLMRDEDCGAIPVVNGSGQLVGMITDRDITVRLVASGYDVNHALVSDCMTEEAFACHVNETVRDCMSVMSRHQIRRLPIVDDRDRVVGIVSQADLARRADQSQNKRGKRAFTDLVEDISEPSSKSFR